MTRGGKREGSGRKPKEVKTVSFHRRVTPEEAQKLDEVLKEIRKEPN